MNLVMLIGRLGQAPEGGYTDLGKAYANFSLATNERWTDQSGQKQERTEWTRIVLWGRTAEVAMQYLKKGSKIAIQGSLKTRSFTGRDGEERKVTEVVGSNLEMLDSNGNGADPAAKPAPSQKEAAKKTDPKAAKPPWEGKPSVDKPTVNKPSTDRPSPNDSPFSDDEEMFPDFE